MAVLEEIGQELRTAADRFGATTVGVGRGWRVGSVVVTAADRVLRAARHAGDAATTISFVDGRTEQGSVIAADRDLGVAVLEAPTGDVEPLEWAPEGLEPAIGTPIVALANPG